MPITPTFPGVYIDEVPSAVRTIANVPTSIAAFVGAAPRGPSDRPYHITSWGDYERVFGGLDVGSPMSYAVYHFYQNGGSEAEIVRLVGAGGKAATIALPEGVPLEAKSEGLWGRALRVRVDYATKEPPDTDDAERKLYNLSVRDTKTGAQERFLNISIDPSDAHSLDKMLQSSSLLRVPAQDAVLNKLPKAHEDVQPPGTDPFQDGHEGAWYTSAAQDSGSPGADLDDDAYNGGAADKTGIHQLEKADIFNMLCLPGVLPGDPEGVLENAALLCAAKRAMLIVDPPAVWTSVNKAAESVRGGLPLGLDVARNAAIYFPNIRLVDAVQDVVREFPPCGAIAGAWARTDVRRGVWKAPAGLETSLTGVRGFSVADQPIEITDLENGVLNPLGVNCLRSFPVVGPLVWGTRTLVGADRLADQWKYVPIRRLALFIEESLYRGTQWVVFEPNDEPLWSSIRLNVGAFMNNLFREGAFQGRTPQEAYLVKCDRENNPQNDIDRGIVNILVGFAPLKPAEFVIIHIQQLAGEIQV